MESVLKISNLKYKEILKNITFSLKEKSFNILIGANGSGKTTLVRAIRGLLKYSGEIFIFNNNINQKDNLETYKNVGFFIDENLYLEDIILNELLEMLYNLNYEEENAKKKIFEITKKLDIVHILYKKQVDLLNYEKTLLLFVFSMIHEPKLLIIDNEMENLDDKYKSLVFNYIENKKNLTVLFITTNSEYFAYANNFLVLKEGKILLECNYDDIIKNEKMIIKSGSKLPFNLDLANKLLSYELLDAIEPSVEKMVDKIWK